MSSKRNKSHLLQVGLPPLADDSQKPKKKRKTPIKTEEPELQLGKKNKKIKKQRDLINEFAVIGVIEEPSYELKSITEIIDAPEGARQSSATRIKNFLSSIEIHDEIKEQHQAQLAINPQESQEFQEQLRLLGQKYPYYHNNINLLHHGEITTDIIANDLQGAPRSYLPIRKASHESKLLQASGVWFVPEVGRWIHFPKCHNDTQCVAYCYWQKIHGLCAPIILMASMNEEEYLELINNQTEEATAEEKKSEPCVLCYRFIASCLMNNHRSEMSENIEPLTLQSLSNSNSSSSSNSRSDAPYDLICNPIQTYRNLVDEPEGYSSDFVLYPSGASATRDRFIYQPIVSASLSVLVAGYHPEPYARPFINQQKLEYHPPFVTIQNPPIGISVSNFLSSNKQNVDNKDYFIASINATLHKEIIYRLLLSNQSLLSTTANQTAVKQGKISLILNPYSQKINLFKCQNQIAAPIGDNSVLSLACAEVIDAFLLNSPVKGNPDILLSKRPQKNYKWDDFQFTKVCSCTLLPSELLFKMKNLGFFTPLAEITDSISHILAKCCINVRCQSRILGNIIMKLLIKRSCSSSTHGDTIIEYNDKVFQLLKQLMLCGLLGNYPGDIGEINRPTSLFIRQQLYDLFSNPRNNPMVVKLLEYSTSVLTICMRIYMIYILEHNPAILSEELQRTIHYSDFRRITLEGMGILRTLFNTLIAEHDSAFYQDCLDLLPAVTTGPQRIWKCGHLTCKDSDYCIAKQSQEFKRGSNNSSSAAAGTQWKWHGAYPIHLTIQEKLQPIELELKKYSYRRPNVNIAKLLRPLRKDFPLIPMNYLIKKEITDDILLDDLPPSDDDEEEPQTSLQDNYLFPKNKATLFIPEYQLEALEEVVNKSGPICFGSPLNRILDFLVFFGVNPDLIQYNKSLFHQYRNQLISTQTTQKALWNLRLLDPHCYNLIQLIGELLEQANRRFHVSSLPLHITQAQLAALEKTYITRERIANPALKENILLDSSVSFVFCDICFRIYSQIFDINSVYKNQYIYGLRDCSFSYLEGKAYCISGKSNHRGSCASQELVRIPLIGKVLFFRLKCIMICCCCARLFCFDTKDQLKTLWSPNGPVCLGCSKKLAITPKKLYEELKSIYKLKLQNKDMKCEYCLKQETEVSKIFCYGKGVPTQWEGEPTETIEELFLCSDHHSKTLQNKFNELQFTDIDHIKEILDWHSPRSIKEREDAEQITKQQEERNKKQRQENLISVEIIH